MDWAGMASKLAAPALCRLHCLARICRVLLSHANGSPCRRAFCGLVHAHDGLRHAHGVFLEKSLVVLAVDERLPFVMLECVGIGVCHLSIDSRIVARKGKPSRCAAVPRRVRNDRGRRRRLALGK